ncbi:hypothetical protein N0V93_007770 [Gnomoniopsis smithogilvyi]|uniref:Phosphatidylinositol-specific phospholipase C X domain-containing protein n=1 Tax=Gnomoniopsis smithogilvyi TaxID=1191159 RepID=A0A9W9CT98_9PEZI|nr:hypothetical protein N0V93_007770 [Gnomoniopsis smithogilvyi]
MHSIVQTRRSRTSIVIFTVLAIFGAYSLLQLFATPLHPLLPTFTAPWTSNTRPPASYHNYTSAFSFDLDLATNPDWMSRIPDNVNLNSLSIPGTHDTLTYDLVDNTVFQCQNHNLKTQLHAGLRYLDIRGRLVYNASLGADQEPVIGIYHGHVSTGYDFQDVLETVFAFLAENPSEGIIMRVKEEGAPLPVGSPSEVWESGTYNTTFEEAFNYYRLINPDTFPGCEKHLLTPWPRKEERLVPTMGEMRGRVLVLYEFETASATYGIPWTSPHIELEDMWIILHPTLLEAKWDAVRRNLEAAAVSAEDSDVLFLSHLSASVGVTPIEAAAGPLEDRTNGTVIDGLNMRTGEWLEVNGRTGKTGVVMADFPGQRLVGSILRRNAWLMQDRGA